MPNSKADEFKTREKAVARYAKALSHPARVAILNALMKRNECVCGEIVDLLPLAQATVSQHLKELKSVGLIKGEIDGPRSCYCINAEAIEECKDILGGFLQGLHSS
ncbi:MAG: metalloregulator ArsR/SmtB family transcription factor [Bacteroidota bacterium]